MKKIFYPWLVALLALVGSFALTQEAHASHAAGGEILYKWVSDSTYKIYVKFYRDCAGIPEPSSFQVCYSNTCTFIGGTLTASKISGNLPADVGGDGANGQEVNIGCPGYNTTCNGGTLPGYREWWYEVQVTLPSRCNFWRFWITESARNGNVTNLIQNATPPMPNCGFNLFVEATLNNLNGSANSPGNSSPYFTVKPVPYVCTNQPYCYNMGAVDPDNDSLVFQLIQPRSNNGGCGSTPASCNLSYVSPTYNNNNNPFGTGNSFTLDPQTGQMCFTATSNQFANIAILVREYRNNVLMGTTMRDIQIISLPCTTAQPNIGTIASTVIGAQINNGRVEGCTGQSLNFCFDIKSADANAVLVTRDNHTTATPGSTLVYANGLTDSVRGCFSWTPGPFDTGTRQLVVVVKDSSCSPPGIPITQSFNIPLYIYPSTVIIRDTAICAGDSVNLLVVGGSDFVWTVVPGGSPLSTLSCTNCSRPVAKPTKTTSYIVSSNLQSICTKNRDTVTITVPEVPEFDAGPDRVTCSNSSVQLDINLVPKPGTTYDVTWTPATGLSAANIPNPVAAPQAPTTYYVSVVPGGLVACAKRDSVKVDVIPGFNIDNRDTAICNGQSVQITGTGDPRYTYTWTPSGPSISNSAVLTPTLTPTTIGTTVYTIRATYPGCNDSVKSLKIDVQPPPTIQLGDDRILCQGDTAQINARITPVYNGYTYTWTPGGLLSDNTIPNPVFSAQETTKLVLSVTTTAGCNGKDSVLYTVKPADYLVVTGDTTMCPGGEASLKVSGPAKSFTWYPDVRIDSLLSNSPKVRPVTSTTYSVFGIDSSGCRDTASAFVEIKPAAVVMLPDTVNVYPGDSIQFQPQINGSNVLNYVWFPATALSATNIANPVSKPTTDIRYIVTGTTEFGCVVVDSVHVKIMPESILQMPNAFAPGNSSGGFKAAQVGISNLVSFRIYNRWGTEVFATNDITQGWDGKLNGSEQPMGVYVYIIDATLSSGRRYYQQGSFTLIR